MCNSESVIKFNNNNTTYLKTCLPNCTNNMFLYLKTVRYNKYKHKKENWITTGILHSIKYRDKLYRKLKQTAPTDAAFSILSGNLSAYKKIVNKTIRNAKRSYYANLFEKSKTSTKDTWAAIKVIMNSNSNQTKFPKYFQINGMRVMD